MKKLFVVFIACLPLFALAQKQGRVLADALLKELPDAKEDTDKVKLLYDLADVYQNINPDEGLKYSQQELILAEKLGWQKGLALADNSLGEIADAKGDYTKSLEYHFKALKIARELGDKKQTGEESGKYSLYLPGPE